MPASTFDSVNAALRTALNKNNTTPNSLDTQLAGSTNKALLANIEFEAAGTYQAVLDKIKSKYVLKTSETPQPSKPEGDINEDETLKLPSYQLYPLESVQLGWSKSDWSVGAGMINMGNTCYLNSTLQALFHVPALVNWFMSDKEHSAECQDSGGLCIICAMSKTLQDSQQRNTNTIRPLLIYNKLRLVCRNLIPGRQEDAHEFLRYLVEAMEKSYLSRFKNHSEFDSKVKETTPLNQILGGYLRSAVRCLKCGHVSTTFQHFQDLLLDIRKAQTLDDALEGYFSREKLDEDSYHCQSCQKKVPATKQFSLERAPMVLCIQLKRFSISNNKITKHINFRQRLDLTRYARHRPSVPLIYRLVALVTHMGPTVNCGHYTAVAQAPTGNFYQFDDSMVRIISHQAVFNTNAYIMLYELESSPFTQKSNSSTENTRTMVNSASSKNNNFNNTKVSNGIGFTSEKVYGPQLPPNRLENQNNGTTALNGNDMLVEDSESLESDSENSISPTNSQQQDENTRSNTENNNCNNSNNNIYNNNNKSKDKLPSKKIISTNQFLDEATKNQKIQNTRTLPSHSVENTMQLSSQNLSPMKTNDIKLQAKLVPYETDDSSCSDESPHELEYRVSTKAAVGEWKVTSTEPTTQSKNWNDKKKSLSDIGINELFKMSHSGYAGPVTSWNGTRAQLDKEISSERREDRKRANSDNSDAGKIKRQKLNNCKSYKSNPGYNPVQEFHNAKNWSQNNGGYHKYYRPRKSFHNKYNNNKNYRYRQ